MFPPMALRRKEMPGLVSRLRDSGYSTTVVSDFAGDIFPRFNAGFQTIDAPELSIPTLVSMAVDQAFPLFLPFIITAPGRLWFRNMLESPNFADPFALQARIISHLSSTKGRPFFLTGFFSTAHFPYAAPWPWNLKFTGQDYEGPYFFQKNPSLNSESTPLSGSDKAQIRGLYQGGVAATDAAIGDILNWLRSHNALRHTIVVITADHGEDLFDDGSFHGHGDHLKGEHVTRVPLIISLPESTGIGGGDISFTTRSVDLMPTLLGLLGIQAPEGDGEDLSPWLPAEKREAAPTLTAYSETGLWFSRAGNSWFHKERIDYPGISGLLSFDPGHSGDIILNPGYEQLVISAKHRSLIRGDYKMIYQPTHDGALFRLYNRKKDPENRIDLSKNEPEQLLRLKELFYRHIRATENKHQLIEDFLVDL